MSVLAEDRFLATMAISTLPPERPVVAVPLDQLQEPETLRALVEAYNGLINGLPLEAGAKLFLYQFRQLSIAFQYALSVHNRVFDASPANVTVQLELNDKPTAMNLYVESWCGGEDMTLRAGGANVVEEDYAYLCGERNPFSRPIVRVAGEEPGEVYRMKSAYCLYYQVQDGQKCFTCPRLKETEREQRRVQARLEAGQ